MQDGSRGDTRMNDTALERQATAWMDDPYGALGHSVTAIHSVPRAEAEAVQLAGLNLRLAQRREQIPVLAKLADAQGIGAVGALDEGARLLFNHDVYKSYPVSLLAKSRFDQLTKWLGRLTPYDLSALDVSDCRSIDDWLVRLREETPLDVATSSGTSGTMSFFFFDMCHDGSWGGIVSGDRIEASYEPCGCGRSTVHLSRLIQRFSELQGGDDKISCAATPGAQAEALGYLTAL
jgi:hypothetical protein